MLSSRNIPTPADGFAAKTRYHADVNLGIVTANLAISLDGYTAGPQQDAEHPFGVGADALTAWMFETEQPGRERDGQLLTDLHAGTGAHIMGRNMFGPGRGEWDLTWNGWWGPEPPYHAPVFVLTHYQRAPVTMEGGTTFTFVDDGIESALKQAREAAGGKDVEIAGGAGAVRQYLAAGLLDELVLHLVPTVLGAGERLFDGVDGLALEPVEVIASPTVTHLRYRRRS
ncbi:dihydrofolate reductase family protein [Nocardia sp. NPDC049149]|uniref:dihydrofolate reductase family protein n=1 Tax=Nocardia sp. NPDC049149 TaxID=3364315 RepID=UPI0037199C5F